MLPYIAEFIGTAMLILLGDGVVANVLLDKSGMKGGGSVQITIAWGLAVLLPVFTFGAVSGAHLNPAVSIGLAAIGVFSWDMVPGYIVAQMLGAMLGALLMYIQFKCQFDATEDAGLKRACFCTAPAVPHTFHNFYSEFIGTFMLVFAILGVGKVPGASAPGIGNLYVFGIIVSIGMSLGGVTGYAINPARDLGPRIMYALIPMKNKTTANWGYSWIPVVAPILGGVVAAIVFNLIPWA
ncbi:MAG: MIP/aquaporin family protein [Synergistaceae bacterium]